MPAEPVVQDNPVSPKTRVYPGIDLIKFICAFFVVFIHFAPFRNEAFSFAKTLNFISRDCICRIAVPFYFTASGFFLFRKTSLYTPDRERLHNYCFKLLRLLGLWLLLLFFGNTGHLWYLGGTVVAVTLLGLCLRFHMRLRYICLLALLLYAIGLLGSLYYGWLLLSVQHPLLLKGIEIYFRIFETTRNGVFMGFLFVLMGALFAHFGTKMKPWVAFIGFVSSLGLMVAEGFFAQGKGYPYWYNMYIFLVPTEFFLFSFACNLRLKDKPLYPKLRTAGQLIYFTHIIIFTATDIGLYIVKRLIGVDLALHRCILGLFVTTIFAFVLEWLSHKKNFQWIRWLIS